jgi:putative ATP-dependent endonuclease of OLD family
MNIDSITVTGFRCFGKSSVSVHCENGITMLIGPNGAGKSALLDALALMFGVTRQQRTVRPSDFYSPHTEPRTGIIPRDLSIDVVFAFPELTDGTATAETIAPSFKHMLIEKPGAPPVCRMRLEAQWVNDQTTEGDVQQQLFWVDTLDAVPDDLAKQRVFSSDRALVQLYYAPATRDAATQIRATTGALASRLLRAVAWTDKTRTTVEEATSSIQVAFSSEYAVAAINSAIGERWQELYDDPIHREPRLNLISRQFDEVIRRIGVIFSPDHNQSEHEIDDLSDGQRSLFYFALVAAVFDVEQQVVQSKTKGFNAEDFRAPALSLFAMEEPENHLSPYYLARIMREVRSLTSGHGAQAVLTSHSSAILGRVEPAEVRYLRRESPGTTSVRALTLPSDSQDAAKYVRNAVLAFPELYFARFVILVEGDSERIVLPRLASAMGIDIDPSFVAIVPLGGRHVQYFWRLLKDLDIPYATLLDLDLGRYGGGFGRIKTACQQLIDIGVNREELLATTEGVLSNEEFAEMHGCDSSNLQTLKSWLDRLETYNVYFSWPLDIDMAMLAAFSVEYDAVVSPRGGPRGNSDDAASAVLGPAGPGTAIYSGPLATYLPLMAAYRYHFMTRSKPATHLSALLKTDEVQLKTKTPDVLVSILQAVSSAISITRNQ